MNVSIIVFSLIASILFTMIYAVGFHTGPTRSLVIFFSTLFFSLWAAGLWLRPAGPVLFGISMVPLIIVAILLSVLLAAAIGSPYPPQRIDRNTAIITPLRTFFWVLTVFLLIAVITGYLSF